MIEQYEKEYQEAKVKYDALPLGNLSPVRANEVINRYWKAYHNLNGAKSADNQNKSRYGFW